MDRLLPYVKDIKRAKFFEIQNVADYFWQCDREYWTLEEFNLAPPFPFFATRWTVPQTAYSKKSGIIPLKPKHIKKDIEILTIFRLTSGIPRAIENIDGSGTVARSKERDKLPGAKWHYDIHIFPVIGRQVQAPAIWFAAVNEHGTIATQNDGQPAFFSVQENIGLPVAQIPISNLHVTGLALTFVHIRNVEIIEPPPPTKKRLPKKVKFESRYHRIKILPFGKRSRGQQTGQPTGIKQSWHIRPGRFRHYGPAEIHGHPDGQDRGLLFGRIAGRFWVPHHVVGDAEVGIIKSDYEVIANEN